MSNNTYKKELKKENEGAFLDINKAFGFMDTVIFREEYGKWSGVEYLVTGYEKDGRVNLKGPNSSLTIFQERLVLVKNGILFQKDDVIKFKDGVKFDNDIVKQHYIPNTNHFSVIKV